VAIELTLIWNNIPGVYDLGSTGQLIPFVIGAFGLLNALHTIILQRMEHVSEKFQFFGW
jgi:hypothetical protein